MTPAGVPSLGVLRLLQICSPAFPIGAFAYSQGLEQAAEIGWLNNPRELGSWLSGTLRHSLARTDLPLLRCAYQLWQTPRRAASFEQGRLVDVGSETTPQPEALALSQRVLAYRETAELRAEEQHLGRSLARLLSHLGIEAATPFATHDDATYLVMFALAAVQFGITEPDMLGGFAFAWAENQVSAASRVMRLGQLAAQGLLSDFIAEVPAAVRTAMRTDPADIGYSSPAFFLASAWHEQQYSRLFRS